MTEASALMKLQESFSELRLAAVAHCRYLPCSICPVSLAAPTVFTFLLRVSAFLCGFFLVRSEACHLLTSFLS